MNAALSRNVDLIPIPFEGGSPVSACVTSDAEGAWRTAWSKDGGRSKELFGPAYSLRDALDVAAALNRRAGL